MIGSKINLNLDKTKGLGKAMMRLQEFSFVAKDHWVGKGNPEETLLVRVHRC